MSPVFNLKRVLGAIWLVLLIPTAFMFLFGRMVCLNYCLDGVGFGEGDISILVPLLSWLTGPVYLLGAIGGLNKKIKPQVATILVLLPFVLQLVQTIFYGGWSLYSLFGL